MKRYRSNKEDQTLPVEGVSLGEVEKDIADLQSFITSLKSGEDGVVEDINAIQGNAPSKPQVKTPYIRDNFESQQERDEGLLDFRKTNDNVEDIRDALMRDYIRNVPLMKADQVLGGGTLDDGDHETLNQITLLEESRQSGLRRMPEGDATFQYPEHLVERSDGRLRDNSNKYVSESNLRPQDVASHSASVARRRLRNRYMDAHYERNPQLPVRKNVHGIKLKSNKKKANARVHITKKMSNKHGNGIKTGYIPAGKAQKSKLAGSAVSSSKIIKALNIDTSQAAVIHNAGEIKNNNNNKQMSRMRDQQNSVLPDRHQKHQKHQANMAQDVETSKGLTDGLTKHGNAVSVQKRRGKFNRKKTYSYHPNPRRRPPRPRPHQPPPTTPTTTTTTTTESSTWTTQTTTNLTMQEIVDSGVDKIDIPLSDTSAWHAIIHGRRDIVLAGAIMGGIGLLLIILSFVYMFVNRRRNQQKDKGNANKNNKSYQRFGSAEETAKLTEPQHSLFPLSSDEDTTGESDEDGTHRLTQITEPPVRKNTR